MTKRIIDTNGWFEVRDNPLSRAGVFEYRGRNIPGAPDPEAMYRVWRPEEELSDPACIESFKLLPWIDDHPPGLLGDDEDGLTPAEEKGVQGVVGEKVYYRDGVLYGNIKVFSEAMERLISAGKEELSCGYRSKYEWRSGVATGVAEGQPYDVIQRKLRGNHLSLVDEGRMGSAVAVLDAVTLDSKDITMENEENGSSNVSLEEGLKIFMAMLPALQQLVSAGAAAPAGGEGAADNDDPDKQVTDNDDAPENKGANDNDDPEGTQDNEDDPDGTQDNEDDPENKATNDDDDKTAAALDALEKEVRTLKRDGVKTFMREISQRNALAERLSYHVGTFDHAEMTTQDVARYGVKKLNIQAPKGQEMAFLTGYLSGAEKLSQAQTRSNSCFALDAAENNGVISNYLTGGKK